MSMKEEKDTSLEKEFRGIFKPHYGTPKGYQGSTMLYVPYEEVIHYIEKTIRQEREAAKEEEREKSRIEREALLKEIVDGVEKMKKLERLHDHDEIAEAYGYNEAIDDMQELIKNKI